MSFTLKKCLFVSKILGMGTGTGLEKLIEERRLALQALENSLRTLQNEVEVARSYLKGIEAAQQLVSGPNAEKGSQKRAPRGTLKKVQEFLITAGRPHHVDQILAAIGSEKTDASRTNLCSMLDRAVRSNWIFNRPSERTYGLLEFKTANETKTPEIPKPPLTRSFLSSVPPPLPVQNVSGTMPPAPEDDLPF